MKVAHQADLDQISTLKTRLAGFTLIATAIVLNTVWVTVILAGVIETILWMYR